MSTSDRSTTATTATVATASFDVAPGDVEPTELDALNARGDDELTARADAKPITPGDDELTASGDADATAPAQLDAPAQPVPVDAGPPGQGVKTGRRVPRTRTGIAWFGLCAAAVTLVVLIVFMVQNTGTIEVTFLWMHGNIPLSLALLIAGVGSALLTMVVGVARVTQLRRLAHRRG